MSSTEYAKNTPQKLHEKPAAKDLSAYLQVMNDQVTYMFILVVIIF